MPHSTNNKYRREDYFYLPCTFKAVLGNLIGLFVVNVFVVCIHQTTLKDFRVLSGTIGASFCQVLSGFTLPVLPLQWSPNAVTFLWVPFYLSLFLLSLEKDCSFHCTGYQLLASYSVELLLLLLLNTLACKFHKTLDIYLIVSLNRKLDKWDSYLFSMSDIGNHEFSDLKCCSLPPGMPCWHPQPHPFCVAVLCLVIGG